MSEWLTTGQMIDTLKPGEIAEGISHWEVKKTVDGGGFDTIVELNSGDQVFLSEDFMKEKWRILPNYVSFEEAMKALKEGKEVCAVFSNGSEVYIDEADSLHSTVTEMGCVSWGVLLNLKWTIEE